MAQSSSLEKAKLQMKNLRKQKAKKKYLEALKCQDMTDEEYKEYIESKNKKSFKSQVATLMWDYNQGQLAKSKYKIFKKLLEQRHEEIIKTQERFVENEKKNIEVILNDIKN